MKTLRKKIPPLTVIRLWARAGGRCEFCNEYLLVDCLTLREANFANIAHIVAASLGGPRGDYPLPAGQRDEIANLMLVCPIHHKLIDSQEYVSEYAVERLREMKREHEDRIERLTAIGPDNKTTILRLRVRFDADTTVDAIDQKQIEEAIAPKYMEDKDGIDIDLTAFEFEPSSDFWSVTAKGIWQDINSRFRPRITGNGIRSVSVFAIAPVPLLVALGNALGSSLQVDLYQRHLDSGTWRWKDKGRLTKFQVSSIRGGSGNAAVLLVNLSGSINRDLLPVCNSEMPAYEIRLSNTMPARCSIATRSDLRRFKIAYQQALGLMRDDNPSLSVIHLFAAVPPAAAVVCGHDLLKKVHPIVHVYDFDKRAQRYVFALKVNEQ